MRLNGDTVRVGRRAGSAGLAIAVTIVLLGCAAQPSLIDVSAPSDEPSAQSVASPAISVAPETVAAPTTFVSVVDGDTIETSDGTVRIIGIDTPERGECGDNVASASIAGVLAAGDVITLDLPPGQNAQDQHGRLIRYVTTAAGVDLGMLQLQAGHAVARFDSRDGYPAHPREADYVAAQLATLDPAGLVITTTCQALAFAQPAEEPWWQQYSSCTKLKKNDVGHPTGPFNRDDPAQAEAYEWFAFGTGNGGDGDGDGLACE